VLIHRPPGIAAYADLHLPRQPDACTRRGQPPRSDDG